MTLDALLSKYGRPSPHVPAGDLAFGVRNGGGEVSTPAGGLEVPGHVAAHAAKLAAHAHAPLVAQLVHHPVSWTVPADAMRHVEAHGGPDALARMAWASPGWRVGVSDRGVDRRFVTTATGPDGAMATREFRPTEKTVVNHVVKGPKGATGWGSKNFLRAVTALRKAGYETVRIPVAAGTARESDNGYYTWPRLGFGGTLRREHRGTRDVHELFDQPGGPEYWKQHGSDILGMTFDLRDNSPHMRRLLAYLKGVYRARKQSG